MTFCYQNQCEDSCWSPCIYRSSCRPQTSDCRSSCDYWSYQSCRDWCPSYSSRCCYPSYSSRWCYPSYSSSCCYPSWNSCRYNYRSCYPC